MKLKLIAICVMALLLCTIVPMTVTTAKQPEKTTINEKVYLGVVSSYYENGEDVYVVILSQKSIGQITIDAEGGWVLSCHKVPSDMFRGPASALGISQGDGSEPIGLAYVPVNSKGYVSATDTFDQGQITQIETALSGGGSFFITVRGLPGLF